jgi:uncharacterized protein YecE (DUF72 family)
MKKLTGKKDNPVRGIYIGTSGWMYKSWHEMFYPRELKKDFLTFYARHYNSLEINTTFYHLPKKSTFEKWRDETPPYFVFAVKMSRYITHIKRMVNCKTAIRRFLGAATGLDNKLGVILVQLPPSLAFKEKVFAKFLADLDSVRQSKKMNVLFAIEPRHPSWFEGQYEKVRELIKAKKMTLVFAHSSVYPFYDPDDPQETFSDFIYIRFHGPKEFAGSEYGTNRLKPWAKRMQKWKRQGKTVFAYFNDDAMGFAVKDAKKMQRLVSGKSR